MNLHKLSEAELLLLTCLSDGMTTDEIASALGKSDRTIDNQINELRKKTGNESRTKLVGDYLKSLYNPLALEFEIDFLTDKADEYQAKADIYKRRAEAKTKQLERLQEHLNNA